MDTILPNVKAAMAYSHQPINRIQSTKTQASNIRSFGPRFWNALPAELRQMDIELATFRRLLKTHLFKCDPGA